jgi:predicted ribosome quality control (RQC) complex YloA/Tae2 family protein
MVFGSSSMTKWAFGLPTTQHAFQVGSNTTNGNGAYLTVGGTWTNASSIRFKENLEEISDEEMLERLRSLEITRWNYKGTEETHIGPMAEQFSDLFGLGVKGDREHISTIDMSGVALRAIQALMNVNNRQETKIQQLEQRLDELEQRLRKLEKRLDQ